jgi:hypothetical protein
MSYLTLKVEIDHGRVVAKDADELPDKAEGLLTILQPVLSHPRPMGLAKGEFIVPEDFNSPLPEDVLRQFEGK